MSPLFGSFLASKGFKREEEVIYTKRIGLNYMNDTTPIASSFQIYIYGDDSILYSKLVMLTDKSFSSS